MSWSIRSFFRVGYMFSVIHLSRCAFLESLSAAAA